MVGAEGVGDLVHKTVESCPKSFGMQLDALDAESWGGRELGTSLRMLLCHGADVHAVNPRGRGVLHLAVTEHDLPAIETLIEGQHLRGKTQQRARLRAPHSVEFQGFP